MPRNEIRPPGWLGNGDILQQARALQLVQGQVLLSPAFCPPTSTASFQQTKPAGKPAGPHDFPLGSPEVLACVRAHLPCWMGYSLSCSSLPCLPGVGISLLPHSPPHCLHLSSASGLLPILSAQGKPLPIYFPLGPCSPCSQKQAPSLPRI